MLAPDCLAGGLLEFLERVPTLYVHLGPTGRGPGGGLSVASRDSQTDGLSDSRDSQVRAAVVVTPD